MVKPIVLQWQVRLARVSLMTALGLTGNASRVPGQYIIPDKSLDTCCIRNTHHFARTKKVQLKYSYQRRQRTQSCSARKAANPHASRAFGLHDDVPTKKQQQQLRGTGGKGPDRVQRRLRRHRRDGPELQLGRLGSEVEGERAGDGADTRTPRCLGCPQAPGQYARECNCGLSSQAERQRPRASDKVK
jgi:hypothetical protein